VRVEYRQLGDQPRLIVVDRRRVVQRAGVERRLGDRPLSQRGAECTDRIRSPDESSLDACARQYALQWGQRTRAVRLGRPTGHASGKGAASGFLKRLRESELRGVETRKELEHAGDGGKDRGRTNSRAAGHGRSLRVGEQVTI